MFVIQCGSRRRQSRLQTTQVLQIKKYDLSYPPGLTQQGQRGSSVAVLSSAVQLDGQKMLSICEHHRCPETVPNLVTGDEGFKLHPLLVKISYVLHI